MIRLGLAVLACAVAAACTAPRPAPAPVSERTPPPKSGAPAVATAKPAPPAKPTPGAGPEARDTYLVKPGDTLYSIALEHGVDYRELAIWNGIDNPSALRVGQELRVKPPASGAVAAPLKGPGGTVPAKPLGPGTAPSSAPAAVPLPPSAATAPAGGTPAVVTEPRAVRLPYSEQSLAQLSKPEPAAPRVESRADARPEAPRSESGAEAARGPDDLDWAWPTRGKLLATFNDASSKGIAIAGKLGQPVLASAPGRVIFSGTGIRGFGKLIVIKHNNTYLSVYAHNSELLVKEGQNVAKGQKIAEMGNSDADQVKLHFEIRRFGKPVDPLKLLPSPA
ncbi:MAG TPA: peptidoglycan DD-metalloendopeptidase family protein [Burkholderiales bacterium]|nr:peptidoglycan DD-metalloendopeptidase family protein [Burkholderiales bacterium]